VVPTKALALVERNLQGDPEELVRVSVRPNDILFRTETAVIYSRLVEGRFPNYRQILPTKHNCRVPLPVVPFTAAVRQAAIMTDEESKKVTFRFDRNKLVLEAQGQTKGRSKIELPIDLDGKPIQINFNPTYVLDLLKVLTPESALILEMEDPGRPAVFRSGTNYTYLAMPLS
jgi:DNA polymerase-3 subunit beta